MTKTGRQDKQKENGRRKLNVKNERKESTSHRIYNNSDMFIKSKSGLNSLNNVIIPGLQ